MKKFKDHIKVGAERDRELKVVFDSLLADKNNVFYHKGDWPNSSTKYVLVCKDRATAIDAHFHLVRKGFDVSNIFHYTTSAKSFLSGIDDEVAITRLGNNLIKLAAAVKEYKNKYEPFDSSVTSYENVKTVTFEWVI